MTVVLALCVGIVAVAAALFVASASPSARRCSTGPSPSTCIVTIGHLRAGNRGRGQPAHHHTADPAGTHHGGLRRLGEHRPVRRTQHRRGGWAAMTVSWTGVADIVAAVCLTTGALLTLIAAIGLVRFPDLLSRMHSVTKPQVLGLLLLIIGLALRLRDPSAIGVLLLVAVAQLAHRPGVEPHAQPRLVPGQAGARRTCSSSTSSHRPWTPTRSRAGRPERAHPRSSRRGARRGSLTLYASAAAALLGSRCGAATTTSRPASRVGGERPSPNGSPLLARSFVILLSREVGELGKRGRDGLPFCLQPLLPA